MRGWLDVGRQIRGDFSWRQVSSPLHREEFNTHKTDIKRSIHTTHIYKNFQIEDNKTHMSKEGRIHEVAEFLESKKKEKTRPNMMIFYNFLLDDEIKKNLLINVI